MKSLICKALFPDGTERRKVESEMILPPSKYLWEKLSLFSDNGGGFFIIGYDKVLQKAIDISDFYCEKVLTKCMLNDKEGVIKGSEFKKISTRCIFVIEVAPSREYQDSFVEVEG